MGDQSSGKSSLVNYLFGDIAVRETGSQAIDTQFTILETVSEHQFIKLVTKQKYKKICQENASKIESFTKNDTSYAWLKEPLQRDNDYRRDLVWTEIGVSIDLQLLFSLTIERGKKEKIWSIIWWTSR